MRLYQTVDQNYIITFLEFSCFLTLERRGDGRKRGKVLFLHLFGINVGEERVKMFGHCLNMKTLIV